LLAIRRYEIVSPTAYSFCNLAQGKRPGLVVYHEIESKLIKKKFQPVAGETSRDFAVTVRGKGMTRLETGLALSFYTKSSTVDRGPMVGCSNHGIAARKPTFRSHSAEIYKGPIPWAIPPFYLPQVGHQPSLELYFANQRMTPVRAAISASEPGRGAIL